jgi:hypothetical protein
MSDLSDAIKSLYRGFFIRDLLSFLTPGTVVLVSALLLVFKPAQILAFISSIPLLVFLPIFGVCYVVGFSVQSFGAMVGLITFFNPKDVPGGVKDNGGMRTREGMKAHWSRIATFESLANDEAKERWERLVVLKQMCGNNTIAAIIAGILLSIRGWLPSVSLGALVALTVVMLISLYWGHRIYREQQMVWENAFISSHDKRKQSEPNGEGQTEEGDT